MVKLGIGYPIKEDVQSSKKVGDEKNSNRDEKKATHDGDRPHIPFDLLESGQKGVKGDSGKKERDPQSHRINGQKEDPG